MIQLIDPGRVINIIKDNRELIQRLKDAEEEQIKREMANRYKKFQPYNRM